MTKPRDAADERGTGDEKVDPHAAKNVDLHRYQVMTIPMELQQELASLKAPRLSDDELKPLPPIEEVVKARQGASSNPPALRAKVLRFLGKYQYVLLGGALILALGALVVLLGSRGPQSEAKAVESSPTPQVPKVPINQEVVAAQPSAPADTTSLANATQVNRASDEPVAKMATSPSQSAPMHPPQSPRVASPQKLSAGASPAVESTNKPQKRAAFKPE